jgi:hypothetical protein
MRMENMLVTLSAVLDFLRERKIMLDHIQAQATDDGEAVLIMHCHIEKDRLKHTAQLLAKIKGVMKIEVLETKKM